MTLRYQAAEAAAHVLNVSVQALGVREPNDFDDAFAEMTRSRPDTILMVADALTVLNRKRIMEFATVNRIPTIFEYSFLVRTTTLRSLIDLGPRLSVRFPERGTAFVVRISEFCWRPSAETDPRTSRCVESCMTRDVDGKSGPIPLHSLSAWA